MIKATLLICQCGSTEPYDACCGRVHRGAEAASSPEQLVRARYAAYTVGDADYLFRTWHPRTRPEQVHVDPRLTWDGLQILDSHQHASHAATVEFLARYHTPGGPGLLHERSRIERRAGSWVYVDGDIF